MSSRLSLFTFEPLREVPEVCSLCKAGSPVLIYESQVYGKNGEAEDGRGFCCGRCAIELVKQLEVGELQQWTEEEAALEAEDLDVGEFRRHRLAAIHRMDGS
jgi:hypothetical protein